MKSLYDVVKSPIITEKTTMMAEEGNKIAFWVNPVSNKNEIKSALEKLFNVTVVNINTQRVAGKIKKMGKNAGRRPTRKKAVITLKDGDKIEFFEGV